MEIEQIARLLIYYIHAPLGGIALLVGGISLIAKKGNTTHKKFGKIFYYSMLSSAIAAFVISVLPNHENPFLFNVGLFSTYFLVSGMRSLRYREKGFQPKTDKIIAYLILIIGISMIVYPIIFYSKLDIVLTVFGASSVYFGIRDLILCSDIKKLKKNWLKLHLGKMTGGYIAAVSAFFVVNQFLPSIWNWFAPGILGTAYITYWSMKIGKKKTKTKAV